MTYEQIISLLDKGLSPDQIMALDAAPAPQEGPSEPEHTDAQASAPEASQRPSEAPQNVVEAPQGPTLADVLQAVHGLTQAVQASAIMGMSQPQPQAPETALDVMRQISNPFNNYKDQKG